MFDFMMISTRSRHGVVEIYPKFIVMNNSQDLMIRGGDFYAIWIESLGLWSTNEGDVIQLIDAELDGYAKSMKAKFEDHVKVLYMWDAESGVIDLWHKYCQKQLRDNYVPLDEKLIFSNQETKKEDYASKKLNYPLEKGSTEAFDELLSTLYSEEERHKIQWAIGAVVTGQSKTIQKFLAFYGPPGSGKSTVLNIIEALFNGYSATFDAEALGSATNAFALEQFKSNPLVAVCHDADLSKIEKNTTLNSLTSHERLLVNEKYSKQYSMRFNSFLFIGTNKPVKITDAKSGLIRRLIDVHPSGNKLPFARYNRLVKQIPFELGAIAEKCKGIFLEDIEAYDDYKPTLMMGESNDFYNFMLDSYSVFRKDDGVTLKAAWEMYKEYCEDAKVPYPFSKRIFKSELTNYFKEYEDRVRVGDDWVRSYFSGFRIEAFEPTKKDKQARAKERLKERESFLNLSEQHSVLDDICAECPAQYANEHGTPMIKWIDVNTKLKDLDTTKVHYLKVPENLIVVDFDMTDESGEKSLDRNLEEASKWPKTYTEVSKGGSGIHLHYIFDGDTSTLSRMYADSIEIKIFTGNSALRRRLSLCNSESIAKISSGLPMREAKVVNFDSVKNEKAIRTMIRKNLNKEYHGATRPSVDFIFKILEDAYNAGIKYDVSDMFNSVLSFAAASTNQSDYCLRLIPKMHFKSDEPSDPMSNEEKQVIFFDMEVFPNVVFLNWKFEGLGKSMNRVINPTSKYIEWFLGIGKLVGFNCRKYDNHILYAIFIGKTVPEVYMLSQRMIKEQKGYFGEAYNISYTDVYDYSIDKKSLKKWQIELNLHHKELGLDWDKPVPEELWSKVSEYCDNDVVSLEAVWHETKSDFEGRQILADITGMSVNETTNKLTAKLIFGNDMSPALNYVDLSEEFPGYEFVKVWNNETKKYDKFNMYREVDLGFGGFVYAEPGMYGNVALLDVVSMHPHSAIAMNYFGKYTPRFEELVNSRVFIKNGEYAVLENLFEGKLMKYLIGPEVAAKLSAALKVAIVSVYGLTSAGFDNIFKDPRNENNIVALRGALFMKTLQDEVVKKGFKVVHIKTDSIKIPDATPEIISFCKEFARSYKYDFDHEATYDRITLVNDAVYISKYMSRDLCLEQYGYIPKKNRTEENTWVAVGTQFQIPYVFKKCFSHEPIVFRDFCEAKEVKSSTIYLNFGAQDPVDEASLRFIGRIGLFTPIREEFNAAYLVKAVVKKDGSTGYDAVTGTKGYKWLESEEVVDKGMQNCVDESYYVRLVDNAIDSINKFGDYEWFVSDDPYKRPPLVDGRPNYNHDNLQIDNPFRFS